MVAEHPNELVRDQYLVTVSDRTRLDLDRLRPRLDLLVRAFATSGGRLLVKPPRTATDGRPARPKRNLRGNPTLRTARSLPEQMPRLQSEPLAPGDAPAPCPQASVPDATPSCSRFASRKPWLAG